MNQKKTNTIILLLFAFIFFIIIYLLYFMFMKDNSTEHTQLNTISSTYSPTSSLEDFTAQDFVESINVGWNLGNALDSCVNVDTNNVYHPSSYYETAWGSPIITEELIKAVADAGFQSIRIPVTWSYNTYYDEDGVLCVREEWMDRVQEVVDYALSQDLYIIIDSHHDSNIIWADLDDIDIVTSNVSSLWRTIAKRFANYDEHVLFEGFNEISNKQNDWKYDKNAAEAVNILNQTFVDTVRSTGACNAKRILVCGTYLNDTSNDVLNSFSLPKDTIAQKLIIDIHSYSTTYNQDIDELFLNLKNFSDSIGAPVIIGEFGTTDSFVPLEYRAEHAGNYVARAQKYGLKCYWWDDSSSYRLFNRTTYEILEPGIISALMHPKEFETDTISTNVFADISQYTYGTVNPISGEIVKTDGGLLTFNLGNSGLPVSSSTGYHIKLNHTNSAEGIRICGLAFYDAQQQFISYLDTKDSTDYDFTSDSKTCFIRICLRNPWGHRSEKEYETYFEEGNLALEITQYM